MNKLKQLTAYFIFGNWFIAIAAACSMLQTELLLYKKIYWEGTLALVFFATLFIYSLHRLLDMQNTQHLSTTNNIQNNVPSFGYYKNITIGSIIAILGALFFSSFQVLLCLIPLCFIALAYSLPLVMYKRKLIRLREIVGLKIIFIAIVWAAATVLLPIILGEHQLLLSGDMLLLVLQKAFFIYAITMLFDIKDVNKDSNQNIKTIPLLLGIPRAKKWAFAAIIISFLIAIVQIINTDATRHLQYNLIFAFFISTLSVVFLIQHTSVSKSPYYFFFLVDGTIVLQFFLVLFACLKG